MTITGIADVNDVLMRIAPREAKNLMRATVFDVTKTVADTARENAPSDGAPLTLKPAIQPKRERGSRDRIEATVRVASSAYFWRFLEYGQGPDNVEHAFFLKAIQALRPHMDYVYLEAFTRKLEARLARERKRLG